MIKAIVEYSFNCSRYYSFSLKVLINEIEYFCCRSEVSNQKRMQPNLSNTLFIINDSKSLHCNSIMIAINRKQILFILSCTMNIGVSFSSFFKIRFISLNHLKVFFQMITLEWL